jgi:hypothetical protein
MANWGIFSLVLNPWGFWGLAFLWASICYWGIVDIVGKNVRYLILVCGCGVCHVDVGYVMFSFDRLEMPVSDMIAITYMIMLEKKIKIGIRS